MDFLTSSFSSLIGTFKLIKGLPSDFYFVLGPRHKLETTTDVCLLNTIFLFYKNINYFGTK